MRNLLAVVMLIIITSVSQAKHLFVFDFDETITKYHTFQETCLGIPEGYLEEIPGNIKPNTSNAFLKILDTGNHIGIATFHYRVDVVKAYLHEIFNGDKTLVDSVAIVVRDDNKFDMSDGKNKYILKIVETLNETLVELDDFVSGISFFDDSANNVDKFEKFFLVNQHNWPTGVEGIKVTRKPEYSAHMDYVIEKLRYIEAYQLSL